MPGSPALSVPMTMRTNTTHGTDANAHAEFNSDEEIDNEINGWMRMYRRELMLDKKVLMLQAFWRMFVPLKKFFKWKMRRRATKRKIFRGWLFVNAAERQNRCVKERHYFSIWQNWTIRRIARNKKNAGVFQSMSTSDAGVASLSAFSGVFGAPPPQSKKKKKNAAQTELDRIREATELKMKLMMMKMYFGMWKKFMRDLVHARAPHSCHTYMFSH